MRLSLDHDKSSGFRERWIAWRNQLLGNAGFQRFASRFPATRFVARRRARALFDIVAGFTYSQTLVACVEIQLFDLLWSGPLDPQAVADAAGLPVAGAERLLRAAAAIGLAERLGDRFALGSLGAALRGSVGVAEMVAHHRLLYADLADPVAMLRRAGGGGLASYWAYAEQPGAGGADQVAAYSTLMAASQAMIADQVLDAYPFGRHRRLLDVGGGEGAFLSAVAQRERDLDLGLFDLPAVAERARERLGAEGCVARIFGGNFLSDALPPGYDLITLVRVLHDHDDDNALHLLKGIHVALPRRGRLLIAEPMAGTPGAAPAGDTYFGLYLLAMGSGRPRRPDEIAALLHEAGFSRSRLIATAIPMTARIIMANR